MNSTDTSEKETVHFRVSLADGSTLEVTTRDTIAALALLRNLGFTRTTVGNSACLAISTKAETASSIAFASLRELALRELANERFSAL